MPSFAIVISVSEYAHQPSLPACRHDGNAVADLLERIGRFDEILHISGNSETVSSAVKNRLSAIADQYRGQHIEEIVFYFSGHGDFDGEDFRYVLSDYNSKKPSQTTLSNSELDGILRNLAPDLFVKIVDACHSGINYVKGEIDLSTYLKGSQSGFNSVYFMFSSQSDEASYASEHVSFFTRSLLKAVAQAPDGPIRYRDLMSAASDEFSTAGGGQTPKFVIQANNTEIFCEVNEGVRSALDAYVKGNVPEVKAVQPSTLIERIKMEDGNYCTREEVTEILDGLADRILNAPVSPEIDELFEVRMEKLPGIAPQGHAIGLWLNDNSERGFFAKPTRKTEQYTERVRKGGIMPSLSIESILGSSGDESLWKTVIRSREVVNTYKLSTELPFGHLLLDLEPKFKPLTPFQLIIAPLISRTHLVLFWRHISFDYSDWDKKSQKAASKWMRSESLLKDSEALERTADEIWSGLYEFVMGPLRERWPDAVESKVPVLSPPSDDKKAPSPKESS